MKHHASLYNVATPKMTDSSALEWPFRPVEVVFKESIQNGGGEKLRGIDSNYIYPPHVLSDVEDVNKLIAGDVWPLVTSNTGKVITVVSASLVHLTSYTKTTLKKATLKDVSSSKGLWAGGEFDSSVYQTVVGEADSDVDKKDLLLRLLKYVVVKRHAYGGGENDIGGGENENVGGENNVGGNNSNSDEDSESIGSDNEDDSSGNETGSD